MDEFYVFSPETLGRIHLSADQAGQTSGGMKEKIILGPLPGISDAPQ